MPKAPELLDLPPSLQSMENLPSGVVYLMGCRSFNQYCCTLRSLLNPERFCPFCTTELERRGRKPTAVSGDWMLFPNEFPNKNTKQMQLLIPKRHVTSLSELLDEDGKDIINLLKACGIESGGVMFRFGDPHQNVGTIEHLHINLVEPICGSEYRSPFAKNISEHKTDYQRMLDFRDKLDALGGYRWWLYSEEGINQTQRTPV